LLLFLLSPPPFASAAYEPVVLATSHYRWFGIKGSNITTASHYSWTGADLDTLGGQPQV
jgi:hypothetical protein